MMYLQFILNNIDSRITKSESIKEQKLPVIPKGILKYVIATIENDSVPDLQKAPAKIQRYYCLVFYPIYKTLKEVIRIDDIIKKSLLNHKHTKSIIDEMLYTIFYYSMNGNDKKNVISVIDRFLDKNLLSAKLKNAIIYKKKRIEHMINNPTRSCEGTYKVLIHNIAECKAFYNETFTTSPHPTSVAITIKNKSTGEVMTFKSKYDMKGKLSLSNNMLSRWLRGENVKKLAGWEINSGKYSDYNSKI